MLMDSVHSNPVLGLILYTLNYNLLCLYYNLNPWLLIFFYYLKSFKNYSSWAVFFRASDFTIAILEIKSFNNLNIHAADFMTL